MNSSILSICSVMFFSSLLVAQENSTSGTATSDKKYALSIAVIDGPTTSAAGYKGSVSGSTIGGSLKLDYLKSPKWGFGIKTIFAGNGVEANSESSSFSGYYANAPTTLATFTTTVNHQAGLFILANLTGTYYIFGNNRDSKIGLFIEFGVGYMRGSTAVTDQTSPIFYYGINSDKFTFINSGLDALLGLGGSLKIGPGKIILEFILADNIYGSYESNVSNIVYAPGSAPDPYLVNTKVTKAFPGYGFPGVSLGYCFNF